MSGARHIGAHQVWQEDDLVCVRYQGSISKDEILAIIAYIDAAAERSGDVYLLVDSNNIVLPSLEVRRVLAERAYTRVRGMVRYQRAHTTNSWLTMLLQNAARLIGGPTTRTKVVETEAEARAWLAQLRQERRSQPP